MVAVGIDIGTSSVKALAMDEHGDVIATSRMPYPTSHRPGGIAEQDPDDYMASATRALADLSVDLRTVTSIGLAGHTPTAVLVDHDHRPTRPAMTWQDTRASAESDELAATFGDATALFGTPLAWSPTALPAKLLWLQRNEPDVVSRTRWVLQPKDYVSLQLTGAPSSDAWSSKGLCDVRDGSPATEFLQHVGWSEDVCPPIAPAWTALGTLRAVPAARLGLSAGIPISVGWSDALAAVLRTGAFSTPGAFIVTGTSDIVGQTFVGEAPPVDGLLTLPSACAPLSASYGPTQSSGDSIAWLSRALNRTIDELFALAAQPTNDPPLFVPFLRGERTPLWRSDVRAVFMNVSAEHGPGDLLEAVMLGVSLSARHVLERAQGPGGGQPGPIHIAGSSTGITRWTEARLRTLGSTLALHREASPSAAGAAALGAAAAGAVLDDVVQRMMRTAKQVTPTPEQVADSDRLFAAYLKLVDFALEMADDKRR
ncbi:MAG: hypothetical protein CVT68_01540 [Actinobacteria bacterium HGW-Actinobacteria-8]|nr:MAG: hypothetical protein CVT68_01540 [Actinobacteria bacterium HGW-Actinobacteria-8]